MIKIFVLRRRYGIIYKPLTLFFFYRQRCETIKQLYVESINGYGMLICIKYVQIEVQLNIKISLAKCKDKRIAKKSHLKRRKLFFNNIN